MRVSKTCDASQVHAIANQAFERSTPSSDAGVLRAQPISASSRVTLSPNSCDNRASACHFARAVPMPFCFLGSEAFKVPPRCRWHHRALARRTPLNRAPVAARHAPEMPVRVGIQRLGPAEGASQKLDPVGDPHHKYLRMAGSRSWSTRKRDRRRVRDNGRSAG